MTLEGIGVFGATGLLLLAGAAWKLWRIFHQQAVHHAIDRELQSLKRESR